MCTWLKRAKDYAAKLSYLDSSIRFNTIKSWHRIHQGSAMFPWCMPLFVGLIIGI